MSVPHLISPLLDDFVMGDPISDHDGVRACPAMHMDTEEKYIVKIISLPASQSKLDALLLAGAFQDKESALAYFKELADGVVEEATLLQKLSKHEGFLSFADWQVVPMHGKETGYDIYLLSHYLPTLENVLRNNQMTHLQALNLGLDLCAALSATRRFGYIYANLRPSNVYLCNEREFRIGDLGFLSLDSLLYASLPDKYHSSYTPPEINDAFSTLNETMDTFAVGLILYQAYNNGQLPSGISAEAPCHADYDLAEIILKACAADPAQRWADPVQMGQALANYMQTHTVNDTPIAPPPAEEEISEVTETVPEEDTEPSTDVILAEVDQALETAPAIVPAAPSEEEVEIEPVEEIDEVAVEADPAEDVTAEVPAEDEVTSDETEDPEEIVVETVGEIVEEPSESEAQEPAEDDDAESVVTDAEDASSEDTAQMLAQADDLIAHQLPDPPVAPDPIEVTLPVPEESPAEEADSDDESSAEDGSVEEEPDEESEDEDDSDDETTEIISSSSHKKKKKGSKKWGILAIVLAVLILLCSGIAIFYQYIYLQTVYDIILQGSEDKLTVSLLTNIVDEKLTVRCTDAHGNTLVSDVSNSTAHFTGLKSGTAYKIEVRIEGFHKLLGDTTCDYFTTSQTVINGFYAATGPENGSVILSFTPQGPSSSEWTVTYSAEGEEAKSVTFAGHMVTLTGLTIGKEYTFNLRPEAQLYVSGTDTITFTVTDLIYAEDLKIADYTDGKLTVSWKNPDDITVPQWFIRCYNDSGFDQTLSTSENNISFEGLDISSGYIIEVTAEGMTLGNRITVSANSIVISDVKVDTADGKLQVTWNSGEIIPAGGWMLHYTVDGNTNQQTISCEGNTCTISPVVPGARYTITIQSADGTTALGGSAEYDVPEAKSFNGYQVKASDMEFSMCKTPNKTVWDRDDVSSSQYTTSFKVGESASFVMHLTKKTTKTQDMVTTLYVVRDADGNLISTANESRTWDDMWDNRYGELTIPVMPQTPGTYTVEIYFNGASATVQTFEIAANA